MMAKDMHECICTWMFDNIPDGSVAIRYPRMSKLSHDKLEVFFLRTAFLKIFAGKYLQKISPFPYIERRENKDVNPLGNTFQGFDNMHELWL